MNQPECDNVSVFFLLFLRWAGLFHASAWVSIQLFFSVYIWVYVCWSVCVRECVSKHKLWAVNGTCTCFCVSHIFLQSRTSYVAYTYRLKFLGSSWTPTPSSQLQLVVVYQNHLVMWWDVVPPSSSCSAGCLPPLLHPRGLLAGVLTEQNVSITLSARKTQAPHQQLLLMVSGECFLMRRPQPVFTPLRITTWRVLWWAYLVSCHLRCIGQWCCLPNKFGFREDFITMFNCDRSSRVFSWA